MAVVPKQELQALFADKKALLKILDEQDKLTGFVPDASLTIQQVRERMIQSGIRPEDNTASREIIRIREGEQD